MLVQEKLFLLKDDTEVLLKSPKPQDAAAMLEFLKQTSGETEFLIRYPEEVTFTLEDEKEILDRYGASETDFMINAVCEGRIIGNIGVKQVGNSMKVRHRAMLGIAVLRAYWQLGLGRELLAQGIETARGIGYEQMELGVYASNIVARSLYAQLGFEQTGVIPRAFRLKDGSYQDEVQMVLRLADVQEKIS